MVTVHYRRWCPPQSPLRIEFPPELLHDVRREAAQSDRRLPLRWIPRFNRVVTRSSGLLFGVRRDDEVRVLAVRPDHADNANQVSCDGLEPVGTFVCRERGEVFLTDDDLAHFEKHSGLLALVVAGGQAGFFVRELNGGVQAIRSHEEFKVADVSSLPIPDGATPMAELPLPSASRWRQIGKRGVACAALLAVPAGAFAYFRPALPRLPIALSIQEDAGQLVIRWNAGVLADGSRLEIQDGSERTILMLPANASSATYGRQGDDVQVRLSTDTRMGGAHWEAARYVAKIPHKTSTSRALQDQISALTREAVKLRGFLAVGQVRTRTLTAKLAAATQEP